MRLRNLLPPGSESHFVASLFLLTYNRAMGGMQFLEDYQWIPVIGARYQMGVDGVAVLLIVLTTLLGVIAALSSWNYIQKREKEYYALLLFLQTAVVGVFASMDLFLFYLFFEVSLVPMYFLIGIWGGENRLYAAIKFFLYTLVGSVVMLLGVLKMYFLTQDTALTSKISAEHTVKSGGNPEAQPQWSHRHCRQPQRVEQAPSISCTCRPWASFCLPNVYDCRSASVRCLCSRLCDQGADVSVSYLAARCARRGAHSRFSDPRRHLAQTGNLRLLSLQPADVPGGFG